MVARGGEEGEGTTAPVRTVAIPVPTPPNNIGCKVSMLHNGCIHIA